MAANVITPGSTDGSSPAAGGSLNLVAPQTLPGLMVHRSVQCKQPDDPYQFTNSLNRTLPPTPPLPAPNFPPGESEVFAFDCYIDLPGGFVGFDIKGDIGSDLSFVFEVLIDVTVFRYDIGVFRCSLLDVEKDPCIFDINTKYLVGQAGLYAEDDADPTKLRLCFKVHANFHIPFKRAKSVNFEECFLTFDKPDNIAIDALSPEPVLSSNITAATAPERIFAPDTELLTYATSQFCTATLIKSDASGHVSRYVSASACYSPIYCRFLETWWEPIEFDVFDEVGSDSSPLLIMLFVVSSLLLLQSLSAITKASPAGTPDLSSNDLDLSPPNTSTSNNVSLGTNLTALTSPTVLTHGFTVPGTQTFLRLGFGVRRHRLDPFSLGGLIAVVEDLIVQGIARDGEDFEPGVDPIFRYQELDYSLGDGFHWEVYSNIPAPEFFTWGQLRNVVRGLELYLVQGQRPYTTSFSFWDGPRTWLTPPLGLGVIALGNDPRRESADQKL
ncbi:hypothetical protein BDR22DRAFT_965966 [Usnea florida]